jgi:hypothetical protein
MKKWNNFVITCELVARATDDVSVNISMEVLHRLALWLLVTSPFRHESYRRSSRLHYRLILLQGVMASLSQGLNRPNCEAEHLHPLNAEFKNVWRFASLPLAFSWCGSQTLGQIHCSDYVTTMFAKCLTILTFFKSASAQFLYRTKCKSIPVTGPGSPLGFEASRLSSMKNVRSTTWYS